MPSSVQLGDATIAFDVTGDGTPLVLSPGCGQPALGFHLALGPALVQAGYQVVTYDQRGVGPSSSPPAPYSVQQMSDDLLGLLDHLDLERAFVAGHSMGGWVAELLAAQHPERVRAAAFMGSCNEATAWEKVSTGVERDIARSDPDLPTDFYACEVLRYLPNHDLQNDEVVEAWLSVLRLHELWPNPGRLGQYEACLAWSNNPKRTEHWDAITVPALVLAFEHDIDSPPRRAKEAAARLAAGTYVELAGMTHLGPITHPDEVARALVAFFSSHS